MGVDVTIKVILVHKAICGFLLYSEMLRNGMEPWGYIMIPSGLVGAFSGCLFRDKKSYFVAGALPWFGLLAPK